MLNLQTATSHQTKVNIIPSLHRRGVLRLRVTAAAAAAAEDHDQIGNEQHERQDDGEDPEGNAVAHGGACVVRLFELGVVLNLSVVPTRYLPPQEAA